MKTFGITIVPAEKAPVDVLGKILICEGGSMSDPSYGEPIFQAIANTGATCASIIDGIISYW